MKNADQCRLEADDLEHIARLISLRSDCDALMERAAGWRLRANTLDAEQASASLRIEAPSKGRGFRLVMIDKLDQLRRRCGRRTP